MHHAACVNSLSLPLTNHNRVTFEGVAGIRRAGPAGGRTQPFPTGIQTIIECYSDSPFRLGESITCTVRHLRKGVVFLALKLWRVPMAVTNSTSTKTHTHTHSSLHFFLFLLDSIQCHIVHTHAWYRRKYQEYNYLCLSNFFTNNLLLIIEVRSLLKTMNLELYKWIKNKSLSS